MSTVPGNAIAILAVAGRFPGADGPEALWENLCAGVEAVSFFTPAELAASGVAPDLAAEPRYVPARGVLSDVRSWDAACFGFSPREAELLDPQQRLFLECAWEVLERAGYDSTRYPGRIGVYAGASSSAYQTRNLAGAADPRDPSAGFQVLISNDKDYLATRASWVLDLRGPAVGVQTACSTSLVAVHQACQSLLNLECDMALAGGVSISVPDRVGYLYQPEGIMSDDGHNHSFDAAGTGSVFGDGAGVVLLKRLDAALADRDPILAVIRGSAVNNDGSLKVGYTAPSVDAQAEVVAEALALAQVDPATLGYLEAHGSATPLGDPIEVAALTRAFRRRTAARGFCALGSVKSNLGHLYTAAGVAGLIKAVLALRHGRIPPTLHFRTPNPALDLAASPFYVNTAALDWARRAEAPRRAAVNSLGIGGTNAHVILEEAPAPEPPSPSRAWQLLPLSARTATALDAATARLARFLRETPDAALADTAWTLQVGRRAFEHRRVVLCRRAGDAAAALETLDGAQVFTHAPEPGAHPVAFLLPGLGEQYPGMGRGLYRGEPAFREAIDRCTEILRPALGLDLRQALGLDGTVAESEEAGGPDLRRLLRRPGTEPAAADPLESARLAHPALFAVEYALARLWMGWGIRPQALLGYSLGEYVAACLAGVFSLEDALRLVAERARRLEELPAGSMLAVPLGEAELRPLLGAGLSLAAVNAPRLCVAAGEPAAVEALERELAARGVPATRVATRHAVHSPLMQPLAAPLAGLLRSMRLQAPSIPYLSNVTGSWITAAQATDPAYWAQHLCRTVRFEPAVRELLRDPALLLLEVGPGQSLGSTIRQHADCTPGRVILPSLPGAAYREADEPFLLRSLGRLWLAGAEPDWEAVHAPGRRRRVQLPTYPFERQVYWIDPPAATPAVALPRALEDLPRQADLADWFHVPVWRETPPRTVPAQPAGGSWLLLLDGTGLGAELAAALRRRGEQVATVAPGESPAAALRPGGGLPERIVDLRGVTGAAPRQGAPEEGFAALLRLAQALGEAEVQGELAVVADHLHAATGGEEVQPEKALLLGPCTVLPLESPGLACRCIDVALPAAAFRTALVDILLAELCSGGGGGETQVALRGARRWVRGFEPVRLEEVAQPHPVLRNGGVYLLTGGLGGLGLAIAEDLFHSVRARLVLAGRSAPSAAQEERLEALRAAGAEILVRRADVTDAVALRAVVAEARERFGALHGVLHAAGVPGGGLIQRKTLEEATAVLAPKVAGTLALEAALDGVDLDFLVLFSSITSIAGGGPGQVDYCAANAFLDAWAQACQARPHRRLTVAVDWGEWSWDAWGKATGALGPELAAFFRENRRRYGISFSEGAEALRRILARRLPQVVVSTQELSGFLALSRSFTAAQVLRRIERERPSRPVHARPALGVSYLAPRTEAERRMAHLWEELLGIDRVGIQDNFFDLGGNSLLGISLISRVRDEMGAALPRHALYEAPTVAALAERVAGGGSAALDEWRDRGEKRRARPRQPRRDPLAADALVAEKGQVS
jgi:acyl transferase domain-containing protein/acyl carrier protein